MLEPEQNDLELGKGIGKHSKGIRYLGVSGKGKGKKPQRKIVKPRVTSLITKALESDQSIASITYIGLIIP